MFRNRGRTRGPSLALFLLANELFRAATTHGIPTVTLFSIIGQIVIFMGVIPIARTARDVCISFENIINRKDYWRLVLSQVNHADDWHLYYNMVSFLWKGRTLETRFGSVRFAITLAVFTICTAISYLFLNKCLAEITEDYNYLYDCSVGFSGVIFALKVLTTHFDSSHVSYFMGIPIGSKYAVWAELVLIQMISPNASFVGHLAGILVGLAYIYGPLSYLVDVIANIFDLIVGNGWTDNRRYYRREQYSDNHNRRSRSQTFDDYAPNYMSEEEQLRRAYEESLRDANGRSGFSQEPMGEAPPTAPPYPPDEHPNVPPYPVDAETLRRLRLRRFQ